MNAWLRRGIFTALLLLLPLTHVSAAPPLSPYGLWVFNSDGEYVRIVRNDGALSLVRDDNLLRAKNTLPGVNALGRYDEKNLRAVRIRTSAESRAVETASVALANATTSTALESFPLPEAYEKIKFTEALVDDSGTFFVRGTTPRGKSVIAYGVRTKNLTELNWDIIEYLPVKKIAPAPGGTGIVILTTDGKLVHAGAWKDSTKKLPRVKIVELNSDLNLIQDITFGPLSEDLRPALAVLYAPDAQFEKRPALRIVDENTAKGTFPLNLKEATPVPVDFEARALLSNFSELSRTTYAAMMKIRTAPRYYVQTRLQQRLERTPLPGEEPCETLLQLAIPLN